MVPAPQYPPPVPSWEAPPLMVVGLGVALVSMLFFVWACLGAPGVIRRSGGFPLALLVVPVALAVAGGAVGYVADRAERARLDELRAARAAQVEKIEARTIAAVEDAYDVEVRQHWFVPDEGEDRVEVTLPDGRHVDDCTLRADDGVLTLECPPAR